MVVNRSILFLVLALVCFAICFLAAVSAVSGVNFDAFLTAGFFTFAAAHLP